MNVPYVLVQHYIKQASGDVLRNENGNKKRQAAAWPSASILGAWGRA